MAIETMPEVVFRDDEMSVRFDRFDIDSYRRFLQIKRLPEFNIDFDPETETYAVSAPARFASLLGVERPSRLNPLPCSPFLHDDQVAIVDMALDAKRFAYWGACGLGKCHPMTEPVLTPGGWVLIGSISPGDRVIGSSGKPVNVLGVYPQGSREVIRVTFNDGSYSRCGWEHLWAVEIRNTHGHKGRVLTTRELFDSGLTYGNNRNSRKWSIPTVRPIVYGPTTEGFTSLPIEPYVLGVILGDGYIQVGGYTTITTDKSIIEYIGVSGYKSDHVRTQWVGNLATGHWSSALKAFGLDGKRSHEKFVPSEYLLASPQDRLSLLQGLMDTDGWPHPDGGTEFSSTSESLVNAVVELSRSLGGSARKSRPRVTQYTYEGNKKDGKVSWRVNVKMPPGVNPFRVGRKADLYIEPTKYPPLRTIANIESEGVYEDSVCIAVDAEDCLYVTRDYVVTHNTIVTLEFARHVLHRTGGRFLITTLNEVVPQWLDEAARFYGDSLPIDRIRSRAEMREWCRASGPRLGVTNYEKWNPKTLDDQVVSEARHLAGCAVDENRLKGGGAKQKWAIIKSCRGIEYKLSLTATPAPNDVMEYASQASYLEKMRTEREILWTYFVRDSKTKKWTVKPHAKDAFFEFMSSWSIYVEDPRRYGWRMGMVPPPPPEIIVHEIDPTPEQVEWRHRLTAEQVGNCKQLDMFDSNDTNAIQRVKMSQVAKGFIYQTDDKGKRSVLRIPSHKPRLVADLIRSESEAGHQVLVWTEFDGESSILAELLGSFPHRTLTGKTKEAERIEIIRAFIRGGVRVLITRAKMLGMGWNFQCCTSMIFGGWSDSFESKYQAERRAVRDGQRHRVRIHWPVVKGLEDDTWENIHRKESTHVQSIRGMEDCYIRARKALIGVA